MYIRMYVYVYVYIGYVHLAGGHTHVYRRTYT
jgi:hypothetical protein